MNDAPVSVTQAETLTDANKDVGIEINWEVLLSRHQSASQMHDTETTNVARLKYFNTTVTN
jgi:hypothetical protein